VFLAKTKLKVLKIERIKLSLSYSDYFCVECTGRAGGFALLWKQGVDLEVVFSNKYIIASLIYSDPLDSPWMLLSIRGPPTINSSKNFGFS
jgi:hypothetical protein